MVALATGETAADYQSQHNQTAIAQANWAVSGLWQPLKKRFGGLESFLNFSRRASKLCSLCLEYEAEVNVQAELLSKNRDRLLIGPSWTLQQHFSDLENSARNGCRSCMVFHNILSRCCSSTEERSKLQCSDQPIVIEPFRPVQDSRTASVSMLSCGTLRCSIALRGAEKKYGGGGLVSGCERPAVDLNESKMVGFQYLKNQMVVCQSWHVCSTILGTPRLPKRLVRVGSETVQLVATDGMSGKTKYIALSYCWGGFEGLRLLKSNLQELTKGIKCSELPKTIGDAAEMALNVNVPYLWVDALCITQDDDGTEFAEEAQRMHEIYGHAVFTLAASLSPRTDSGLFSQELCASFAFSTPWGIGSSIFSPDWTLSDIKLHSPLSGRGWTFQEELTSPCVVYWSNRGVFWSCMGAADTNKDVFNPQIFWTHQFPLDLWPDMVEDYSKRAFTKPRDRLPALAGLVEIITRKAYPDECISGHWRSQLPNSLLWIAAKSSNTLRINVNADDQLAPSWSWASMPPPCPIQMPKRQTSPLATIVDIKDVEALQVRGRLLSLLMHMREVPWPSTTSGAPMPNLTGAEMHRHGPCFATGMGQIFICRDWKNPIRVRLDSKDPLDSNDLWCLEIAEDAFLLLYKPAGGEPGSPYRRVGCAQTCEDTQFFDNANPEIVTIA